MQTVQRLFTYFEPKHYTLVLDLHREERTFSGTVVIDGRKTGGYEIMLHAKDLDVSSITIDDTVMEFVQNGDELTITPDFPAGDYRVRFDVQARRPLRASDRFTLLVHPRWGELTGGWSLAERAVTATDLGAGAQARGTFMLEFHNPAPALLSFQLVGAKSAGVQMRRIVVEPRLPLPEFAAQMAQAYENLVAE